MADLLRIEDLRVRFDAGGDAAPAVAGVSLSVAPGEVLALVGESGSGKTVTARSVLGLLPATASVSGRVLLGDGAGDPAEDVLTASAARLRALRGARAAMVFQEPSTALNPVFTIGWQLAEGLRAHGVGGGRAGRRALAVEMLDRVGIPEPDRRVDHYPHQLSGGQKQRAVIAMALALGAGLLVADEPTTALDVTVQAEILALLHRCRVDFGTAVLLITHNMGVVADLADRVAVMRRGRIVEQAPVHRLFAEPAHPYTRELLAAVPDFGRGDAVRGRPASKVRPDGKGPGGGTYPGGGSPVGGTGPDAAAPGTGRAAAVRAEGLVVDYPGRLGVRAFRAVDRVAFEIAPGEVLGLVGESGSGKTTIGRAVAGLTRVTAGVLDVLGEPLGAGGRSRRGVRTTAAVRSGQVGFVFQDPATSFNPQLTVADSVGEPLAVHRRDLDARAVRAAVDALLESVRLPRGHGDRYPHELSGGERQRAGLARALALRPRLVIADEPTSALDVSVQARVLDLFTELQREQGFAALFISHDLAVVEQVADRVAVLHRGRIVESGTAADVLGAPRDAYTRRLIASLPVPDPRRQARRGAAPLG